MRRIIYFMVLIAFCSCSQKETLLSSSEQKLVKEKLAERKQILENSDYLEAINSKDLSETEREALQFLYAYMPLGDMVDYSWEYYLENIEYTYRAKAEMPWGANIPMREFKHFVLPVRVNNENLDDSRKVFYEELKDRVKGLSMEEAVLEVNHWCHEKVVYRSTDRRTSSSLASVKTAFGRCGEESTFATAAMRSVGIPARQVYTPRWAHTDDNHAWVEVWIDGVWKFLGACEPEPILNLGWFNDPASRALLMHTKVFGDYNGPEPVIVRTANHTEINIADNYVPTSDVRVQIVDMEGKAVQEAIVELKIYNYADLFTVMTLKSDKNGFVDFHAGKGDMVVWATKADYFGFDKISFRKDTTYTLALNKTSGDEFDIKLDLIPPPSFDNAPTVTKEMRAENSRRMAQEDSIRKAYTSTFYTKEMAMEFMGKLGFKAEGLQDIIVESYGNHGVITTFLKESVKDNESYQIAFDVLHYLLPKDWRDITLEVLRESFAHGVMLKEQLLEDKTLYGKYVVNPRIEYELLSSYKKELPKLLGEQLAKEIKENPQQLSEWCKSNLKLRDDLNVLRIPMSAVGVLKSKVCDATSRKIFFVAALRSLDIPARVNEVTAIVQYMGKDKSWIDVDFDGTKVENGTTTVLKMDYTPSKSNSDPKYENHYTISKMIGGIPVLQTYPYGEKGSWSKLLKNGLEIEQGYYSVITGTRLANGTVLTNVKNINLDGDNKKSYLLKMRESSDDLEVLGSFNSESKFKSVDDGTEKSILSVTGRGYFVVAILGAGEEPSNHALRGIAAVASELEKWGREMVLLFESEADYKKFKADKFENLPSNITFGIDSGDKIKNQIVTAFKLRKDEPLPLILVADTFNRVVFISKGYTIGVGEQLTKVIGKL